MKRIVLAVMMLALFPAAVPRAEAATEISLDFFYDNLGSDGNWVEVADYGYCWQPAVAVSSTSWRPYADGYWAYTEVGWTWVSYEDFGWATYHYGRWIRLRGRGWIWVPGRDWAPAWVSWRTGGDYVGWAPLPPRGGGDVFYDYSPITAQVDVQFDIGPAYYNFVDIRYIGEPVLRERIFAPELNVTYITNTVNVTNITYTNSTVYNYGPDYNLLSRYSARPIQRLSLQREANTDPLAAARSRSLMKVQGDKLVVAAPPQLQKPSKPVAPKVVKEKLTQAPIEHGWEPVGDPKKQAELKQKIRAEDPKTALPPSVKPREESAQNPVASPPAPAASTAPATGAGPAITTNPKAVTMPPSTETTPSARASSPPGKQKNKRGEKPASSVAPSVPSTPALIPGPKRNPPPDDRQRISPPVTPPTSPNMETMQPVAPPPRDKGMKKERPAQKAPEAMPPVPPPVNEAAIPQRKQKVEPIQVHPGPNREMQPNNPSKEAFRPQQKGPKREAPPQQPPERILPPPGPPANAPTKPESSGKGHDKKKPEPAGTPGS